MSLRLSGLRLSYRCLPIPSGAADYDDGNTTRQIARNDKADQIEVHRHLREHAMTQRGAEPAPGYEHEVQEKQHHQQPQSLHDVDVDRSAGEANFFFQAEDGIRDDLVTGVQTCALPI